MAFEQFNGTDVVVPAATKFECGICWTVYDPAVGDSVWQIAAGTAFADLPQHWTCPNCDAPRNKFMVLGED
jgi:rubredoxin